MGLAARVRAAIAYRDLSQSEVARALGVSPTTVGRWQAGTENPPSGERQAALAALCEVPVSFLADGFEAAADGDGVDRRLARLERQMRALEERTPVEDLRDQLTVIAKQLNELGSPGGMSSATAEDAVNQLRHATSVMEELLGRLGRDVGRRDVRFRSAKDRPPEAPPTAA